MILVDVLAALQRSLLNVCIYKTVTKAWSGVTTRASVLGMREGIGRLEDFSLLQTWCVLCSGAGLDVSADVGRYNLRGL